MSLDPYLQNVVIRSRIADARTGRRLCAISHDRRSPHAHGVERAQSYVASFALRP